MWKTKLSGSWSGLAKGQSVSATCISRKTYRATRARPEMPGSVGSGRPGGNAEAGGAEAEGGNVTGVAGVAGWRLAKGGGAPGVAVAKTVAGRGSSLPPHATVTTRARDTMSADRIGIEKG
jgi:hypothetical protein